jgi:hypothetical protein
LLEPSREIVIGLGRRFLWVRIMEDEISEHFTHFCWVCYAGKMPASNILYNILWVQEDERRARNVIQQKKTMDAAGIEPVTSR